MKACTASILFTLSVFATNMEAASADDVTTLHIPRAPVQSSAIAAVGYSKRSHVLEIEFVNGAIYRYLDVPPDVYHDLLAAKSKARFYDQNIRAKYRSVHVRPRRK
jgi:KTSC domain